MARINKPYTSALQYGLDGTIDYDTDTIKAALVTSSYIFDAADTVWADVSANEVATGSGYTTGGVTVTGSVSSTAIDVTDPAWTALTKTFAYLVFYKSGTANSVVNPLICCVVLDDDAGTPQDVVIAASDYTVPISSSGLISLSVANSS